MRADILPAWEIYNRLLCGANIFSSMLVDFKSS